MLKEKLDPKLKEYITLSPDEKLKNIWNFVQRGLVYTSPHAIYASFWLKDSSKVTREELAILSEEIRKKIKRTKSLRKRHTSAILGTSLAVWRNICKKENRPLPKGLQLNFPSRRDPSVSTIFRKSGRVHKNSGVDLWFHIKSNDPEACDKVFEFIKTKLGNKVLKFEKVVAASKSDERPPCCGAHMGQQGKEFNDGKVLGNRFSENLNNPADPVTISKHSIVGTEDIKHLGASYVFAQNFLINWNQIHSMSEDKVEDLIGRKTNDTIIPNRDTRAHIKSSRVQDERGNTTPVLRLGLPFGHSPYLENPHLATKGNTLSDEKGIYFAGFAKSAGILENIIMEQIGSTRGFMNDRLFNNIRSNLGGFFYIPSILDLKIKDKKPYHFGDFKKFLSDGNWKEFPGVDWSRLSRHFDDRSKNGWMFYNHKNYLYSMSINDAYENRPLDPPTARILSLLENSFSRWQDNWYIDRKQQEMGHIVEYMKTYKGKDKPADIMNESIMVRKGWASRLTLHLLASEEYGFRGQRIRRKGKDTLILRKGNYNPEKDDLINGADSYRIEPEEIIVGALPNLSLGQGRYVMKYLSDDERLDGIMGGLSEASGVGHCIPDFEKVLDRGLSSLIKEVEKYYKKEEDEVKKDFYQAIILSLKGVSEYSLLYADLAKKMAGQMTIGQKNEKENLLAIEKRMRNNAKHKPESFVEAVQLVYTLHSALHLNGEPTALGRLDQVLNPYYEADLKSGVLTFDEAQEIIDAFIIKLDEKVQQNRIFVEDHQPSGYLAFGGFSGPYPQGAANNQWIQQLTIGGTVANEDKVSKPAYNDLTKLFLRGIRRLPVNAPCISLRVRPDIPEDILEEAARAILSGGAHPILLNDELFIEGLRKSGDDVGGNIANELGDKWNSKVSLRSARNYACDGCYEPQFPGENWFALGGMSSLQALECALNRGRTYSSAGTGYLRGQNVSFTSKPAAEIKSFDELLELYFEHFKWMNTKNYIGAMFTYGANTAVCPAPLLSVMMDNCLEKGLDYYSGGPKYQIFAPLYTGLSSTINSFYAIKEMVFHKSRSVTSLPELLDCLSCDWGHKMVEPFVSMLAGESRIADQADRYKRLRKKALSMPKFLRGHQEVDDLGRYIMERIAQIAMETFTKPVPQFEAQMKDLAERFGTAEYPFGIQIQPGVGTFENHVDMGAWSGASADGRRLAQSVASDASPTPSADDLPIDHQYAQFTRALAGAAGDGMKAFTDGAPTDFNIPEDFPFEELMKVLKQFAAGKSSNILTITTASPGTMQDAVDSPERYDLLRVRTGGWTEFFTAMFPDKQAQQLRRPISTPE